MISLLVTDTASSGRKTNVFARGGQGARVPLCVHGWKRMLRGKTWGCESIYDRDGVWKCNSHQDPLCLVAPKGRADRIKTKNNPPRKKTLKQTKINFKRISGYFSITKGAGNQMVWGFTLRHQLSIFHTELKLEHALSSESSTWVDSWTGTSSINFFYLDKSVSCFDWFQTNLLHHSWALLVWVYARGDQATLQSRNRTRSAGKQLHQRNEDSPLSSWPLRLCWWMQWWKLYCRESSEFSALARSQ